jgi:uncharacterized protein YndB with AHSA1/START domain
MNLPETSDVVEREVRIAARPEVVFAFFVDPAKMVRWKGSDAMLDPRPGGVYRVAVTPNDVVVGEYLEVIPPSRVVFTWGWENSPVPPGSTVVEVNLVADGDGTILRLSHRGLAGEALLEHTRGWQHYLARLVIAAQGDDPGPDSHALGQALPDL